jgi:hypothetical protein
MMIREEERKINHLLLEAKYMPDQTGWNVAQRPGSAHLEAGRLAVLAD